MCRDAHVLGTLVRILAEAAKDRSWDYLSAPATILIVRPSPARVHAHVSARYKKYLANRIRFGAAFLRQTCEADIRCYQAAPTPFRRWNVRHFRSEELA